MTFYKILRGMWKKEKKNYELSRFAKRWKSVNSHNKTKPHGIYDLSKITIGRYTYGQIELAYHGVEDYELEIGSFCSIANGVVFMVDGEHDISGLMTFPIDALFFDGPKSLSRGKITIGDDVWIGRDAVIMSGVTVGNGAVIATRSVVTKDVPAYAVVGGIPAKVIKYRFDGAMLEALKELDYDKIDKAFILNHQTEICAPMTQDALTEIKVDLV